MVEAVERRPLLVAKLKESFPISQFVLKSVVRFDVFDYVCTSSANLNVQFITRLKYLSTKYATREIQSTLCWRNAIPVR